jgi:two-component system chemotaxis response regulator CheY
MTGNRLLIVDDDPVVQMLLSAVAGRDGWAVTTANDGAEAIAALAGAVFDAVVTDLNMPNVDGAQLLAHIRGNAQMATLPVVLLTATADAARIAELSAAGATACMAKPIDPRRFAEELRNTLRVR